jgi:glyoxylase-like metal-dependent hydrolase (beta-lactamase superfamily II)
MPYPSRRFGDAEIVPLCDQATAEPLSDGFPDPPDGGWDGIFARYPAQFLGDAATWNAHTHCFLIRIGGVTVLVDAGIGPAHAPYADGVASALPGELAAAGVAPEDVDHVVITHLHGDHYGWCLAGETPARPMFPRARYHLPRADWGSPLWNATAQARAEFDLLLAPLEGLGVLELTDDAASIAPGVVLEPTPGHTAGHRCVRVEAGDGAVLVAGDLAHHPAEVEDLNLLTSYDEDRELGRTARAAQLRAAADDGIVLATAHFVEPFGRIEPRHAGLTWAPVA